MNIQLASFLYFNDNPNLNLHTTVARLDRYLHSLRTLNSMGYPIKFLCGTSIADRVKTYITENKLSNINLEVRDITEFKHTNTILSIKEKYPDKFKFYLEIGWAKLELLKEVYENNPDADYIYWVDCGLSHRGLFPDRYAKYPDQLTGRSTEFENYNFIHIFNQDTFHKISKWCGDKLIDIRNSLFFHAVREFRPILETQHSFDTLSVGGIIGGKRNKLQVLFDKFEYYTSLCLAKEYIVNHEAILSTIALDYPEYFRSWKFSTWYHDDSKFTGTQPDLSNKVSFYEFFNEL